MTGGNRSPLDGGASPFFYERRRLMLGGGAGCKTKRPVRPRPTRAFALRRQFAGQTFVPAEGNRSRGYLFVKRALDLVGATAALALFAPVMLPVFCVLLFTTKGRPIFVQMRVGHQGRRFSMFKFRTMRVDAEQTQDEIDNEHAGPIFKNRRDPRITRIGRLLRTSSVDEMPQLFNVLAGHMSLVGPRPPVPKEVVCYAAWQRRRLAVKPGLTCLWQVSGRSNIGFEDWVRMDLWYLKRQSLWVDLKLLAKTPWSVLSARGAY